MRKRKTIIVILALFLVVSLIVSLILYGNRKESKMAVFESKEQFARWLAAGDYGAAPSRFNSTFGGHPDLDADVSYLVPLIKEYGIPTITCDEEDFAYTGGYITLSPYAQDYNQMPQIIFHLKLNGYKYTVYATYITEGVRDLIENFDVYEAGLEESERYGLKSFLRSYLYLSPLNRKEFTVDGVKYSVYETKDYDLAYTTNTSFKQGKAETDHFIWKFISGNFVYGISFDAGKNKESYDAVTAQILKLMPTVISYEELTECGG